MSKNDRNHEIKKLWDKVIAKAMADENFKKRLFANPEQVLKEFNINLPEGQHIKFIEDTKETKYIVFPTKLEKTDATLSENDLKRLSAGYSGCTHG